MIIYPITWVIRYCLRVTAATRLGILMCQATGGETEAQKGHRADPVWRGTGPGQAEGRGRAIRRQPLQSPGEDSAHWGPGGSHTDT